MVTNAAVLAGAAQLALCPVAAGGTQLLTALGRERTANRDVSLENLQATASEKNTQHRRHHVIVQMMRPQQGSAGTAN